ncbi:DUF2267 domain-containing protein [Anaeromyxobacter oryzae]|uniref:DUF2267 domain-containing protein n=1 Tax=Anaeromyxobacter oryzae TaxID=2918170 RepID=A0ABM7X2S8_9BACT|nr:DUF2267 domain-containing protein [Anaeromyxobacter oryzae]BDG06101.1 hypothetical protein AMOR_50970 [Anaeromyxobacter oryzae]
MADVPDRHSDADYRALVEALAREGLPRRTEAVRAVEAVACALARRIGSEHFEDLRELLPEPFRGRLVACERHATAERPIRTAEDFYASVADDLGRDPSEVEGAARAVFAALRTQVTEQEADDLGDRLPPELLPLWRRPS